MFRQASNHWKRVLKAAKHAYFNKTKESIAAQKLGSRGFWWCANSVLNKGKSAKPPLFNSPEVLSSASDKAELFAENFSKNSNLDGSVSLYLISHLKLIWNCIIFLHLPRWLKMSLWILICQRHLVLIVFQWWF